MLGSGRFGRRLAWVLLGASTLALAYGIATHTSARGSSPSSLALAYGPPLVAFLLGVILLRVRAETADALGLGVVATVVSLYLAEAGLLAFVPPDEPSHPRCRAAAAPLMCNIALGRGLAFDTRPRVTVVEELEARGESPVPGVFPSGILEHTGRATVFPLAGVANALTVYCNETGEYVTYVSDEHGFRNPPGLHGSPASVALVGDSHTQGACVRDTETLGGVLRETHPATLSLGMDGNGPLLALATIKEYLPAVAPRTVFWLFFEGNDLNDLEQTKDVPELLAYLRPDHTQDLRSRQAEIDAQWRSLIEVRRVEAVAERDSLQSVRRREEAAVDGPRGVRDLALVRFVFLRRLRDLAASVFGPAGYLREANAERYPDDGGLLLRIAGEARRTVEGWGGRLVVVYLPSARRFTRPRAEQAPRERLLETFGAAGLPLIDAVRPFAEHGDPVSLWPFPPHATGHYIPEGYQLVADLMLARLDDAGPTP